MNRILMFIGPLGVDPVQRYYHIVTKDPRRRRRGVEHGEIRRRANDNERAQCRLSNSALSTPSINLSKASG